MFRHFFFFFTIGLEAVEVFRGEARKYERKSKQFCSHHQNPRMKSIISLKCIKVLFLAFGMVRPVILTLRVFC